MADFDVALWHAKTRSSGPQRVPAGSAAPAGFQRLIEPDGQAVWLVPGHPDEVGPAIAEELGLRTIGMDQPNETARALAACVRCCWLDPSLPLWPGIIASWAETAALFDQITAGRDPKANQRILRGAVNRLAAAQWLLYDQTRQSIRLGPRVTQWSETDHIVLRELWRDMPLPASSSAATGIETTEDV